MTVKELRDILKDFDDDVNVMIKKTDILGNVGYVNSVRKDTYSFFGTDVPCVLLTDEIESQESEVYVDALEKIRTEIEQAAFKDVNGSKYIFVNRVNRIIDKYKAKPKDIEVQEKR